MTHFVEGTLGDLGKDFVHWVDPRLDGLLAHWDHFGSVFGELTAEENIHQVNLKSNTSQFKFMLSKAIFILFCCYITQLNFDFMQHQGYKNKKLRRFTERKQYQNYNQLTIVIG